MGLPSTGAISLSQIEAEFGGTAPTSISEYYSAASGVPGNNNPLSLSDFYGTSAIISLDDVVTPVVINGQNSLKEITVSDYIISGGVMIVPTNWWIWSDNINVAGMTIDIPCTIINNGKIIGRGGNGGYSEGGNGYGNGWSTPTPQPGGPAIRINSGVSGVTIENNSGSYIAGGGGGGGGGYYKVTTNNIRIAGGGGGAGGGHGGRKSNSNKVAGGVLNAEGTSDPTSGAQRAAWGGGAGGGGGHGTTNGMYDSDGGQLGAGGGRILPGVGGYYSNFHSTNYNQNWSGNSNGHTASTGNTASGGAGGSANGAGNNCGHVASNGAMGMGGGGGGGWGAAGGRGGPGGNTYGGVGGKAIEDTGNTYTLTNNGTIYGATT